MKLVFLLPKTIKFYLNLMKYLFFTCLISTAVFAQTKYQRFLEQEISFNYTVLSKPQEFERPYFGFSYYHENTFSEVNRTRLFNFRYSERNYLKIGGGKHGIGYGLGFDFVSISSRYSIQMYDSDQQELIQRGLVSLDVPEDSRIKSSILSLPLSYNFRTPISDKVHFRFSLGLDYKILLNSNQVSAQVNEENGDYIRYSADVITQNNIVDSKFENVFINATLKLGLSYSLMNNSSLNLYLGYTRGLRDNSLLYTANNIVVNTNGEFVYDSNSSPNGAGTFFSLQKLDGITFGVGYVFGRK